MALPDLLQWVGANRKSGVLELERCGSHRRIAFSGGCIVACSTDDPALLGHFLLSANRVTPDQLRVALECCRSSGKDLRRTLSEMGALDEAEIERQLAKRAEETIYSLFEWTDARFRFEDGAALETPYVKVDVTVDAILLNGLQRLDEMAMIRRLFHSSGMILARTGTPAPPQISNSGMARRILRAVDGRTSLAELLRQSQVSEFLVLKFLYHLVHKGVLVVQEVRQPPAGPPTLLDEVEDEPQATPEPQRARDEDAPQDLDVSVLADVARLLSGGLTDHDPDPSQGSKR